jgi:hypothetical protein
MQALNVPCHEDTRNCSYGPMGAQPPAVQAEGARRFRILRETHSFAESRAPRIRMSEWDAATSAFMAPEVGGRNY